MYRLRRFLPHVMAAVIGAAIVGAPSQARADFNIYLQEASTNGGAIHLVASGSDFQLGGINFSGTYGGFLVEVFGGASHNAATLSDLLNSTVSVTNQNGTSDTLKLYVTQTNYTLPAGSPLRVESGLGGSTSTGSVVLTNIYQAFADKNNNVLGMSDFTNGPQTANPTGSTFDTGSATGVFGRTGNFSLTSVVTFTMSAGARANYSAHINVTAVPAPAGIVLAFTGLPVLVGTWLRRRKAVVA